MIPATIIMIQVMVIVMSIARHSFAVSVSMGCRSPMICCRATADEEQTKPQNGHYQFTCFY